MSEKVGYIPLNRRCFEHELWLEPRVFIRAEAFADLLRRVRFEANTCTMLMGTQSITIEFLDYLITNRMITKRKPYDNESGTRKRTHV